MTNELHKMAEIAADYSLMSLANTIKTNIEDIYEKAIELGYKEAITRARQYLENRLENKLKVHQKDIEHNVVNEENISLSDFLADFEADMNKLWEEQK